MARADSWETASSFAVSGIVFLKGSTLSTVSLSDPCSPVERYQFSEHAATNSSVVASPTGGAIFADGNRLIAVRRDGAVSTMGSGNVVGEQWEVNWEMASSPNDGEVWFSALRSAPNLTLGVFKVKLGGSGEATAMFQFEYPDSGAYAIDATRQAVALLRSDGARQQLVLLEPGGKRFHRLRHRFEWIRVSPSGHQVLLSCGAAPGPIVTVRTGDELVESVLGVTGLAAGWAGPNHVTYHSPDGSLRLHSLADGDDQLLVGLPTGTRYCEGGVVPASSDDTGAVVAWPWMAIDSTDQQSAGTALVALRERAIRHLTSYCHRCCISLEEQGIHVRASEHD